MNRNIRFVVAAILLLSILFLARNQVAWADKPSDQSLSAKNDEKQSVVADRKDNDCDKDKGKDKDKCKGSVKPPPRELIIPVTGEYSVGGFCTLRIELNDPGIHLEANIKSPLPRELPDDVHKIRQGCLLTYYSANQRINELPSAAGNTTICFAATPEKQMTIYFYDIYSVNPTWVALQTTVNDGIACATGNGSGVYVATFQNP